MSRPNGTYLLPEREVYVEDSYENKVWEFYHEQTRDPILAYAVEIEGVEGDTVKGNLIELDYAAHVERMQKLTVPVEDVYKRQQLHCLMVRWSSCGACGRKLLR